MHSPYTSQPLDALTIAQTSVALGLTALVWSRPARAIASSALLLAAIWWAALLPLQEQLLRGVGLNPTPIDYNISLVAQATMGTVAATLTRRRAAIAFAVIAEIFVIALTGYIVDSDWELAAVSLASLGALVGFQLRSRDAEPGAGSERPDGRNSFVAQDLRSFAVATLLAMLVCVFVLKRRTASSDEWAYTFQAATFAKGRAYAPAPPCSAAYQNYYVFELAGRMFSQYTPGWPLYMAPFALGRVVHFSAATTLGLLVVAVARLARRAARDSGYVASTVAAAGTFASLCTMLSSTLLVNGGSRFGHVFATALLAWSIEAICATEDAARVGDRRAQLGWATLFGLCAAMLWATRPGEGTVSAIGVALYGLYALWRGRLPLGALAAAAAAGALVAGATLVILHMQLKIWFTTGYAMGLRLYPSLATTFGWPEPQQWKHGVPLAVGSYCWWPLSPAVGVAGLVATRGRGTRIAFMAGLGAVAVLAFNASIGLVAAGVDWGYGPRYVMATVVAMAVGAGVAFGRLWTRACQLRLGRWRRLLAVGPLVLAGVAIVVGVGRLIPLVYPFNTAAVDSLNTLNEAIEQQGIHHAVVLLPKGMGWMNNGLDFTMNLPLTLYPDQDVIVALATTPELTQCLREHHPGRTIYTALPGPPVQINGD
jgi:hypothetical protein